MHVSKSPSPIVSLVLPKAAGSPVIEGLL
jgi:hypothetical protein